MEWIIVRINRREEPKQNLQVGLGEASLHRLGGLESSENLTLGSTRRWCFRLGGALSLGMDSYA